MEDVLLSDLTQELYLYLNQGKSYFFKCDISIRKIIIYLMTLVDQCISCLCKGNTVSVLFSYFI